jgi:hypothetical protein
VLDPAMSQADVDYALVQGVMSPRSVELDMAHPISQPEAPLFRKAYLDMDSDVFELDSDLTTNIQAIPESQTAAVRETSSAISATYIHEQPFAPPIAPDDIDEMLFTSQAAIPAETPLVVAANVSSVAAFSSSQSGLGAGDHLQLVHSQSDVDEAIRKVRTGSDLSADEAAKALDALKRMSVEDRTRLFS